MNEICPYCGARLSDEYRSAFDENTEIICADCTAIEDAIDGADEPDHDDTVHCCPDCERPNQFGELCFSCAQDRGEQPYA